MVFCLQKTKSGTPKGVPHAVCDGAFAAVLWAFLYLMGGSVGMESLPKVLN